MVGGVSKGFVMVSRFGPSLQAYHQPPAELTQIQKAAEPTGRNHPSDQSNAHFEK